MASRYRDSYVGAFLVVWANTHRTQCTNGRACVVVRPSCLVHGFSGVLSFVVVLGVPRNILRVG